MDELDKDYGDMMMEFDESEPTQNAFNAAIDAYWFVLTDPDRPPLDDPVHGYDHWEKVNRIEELKKDPNVAPFIERIEDHLNRTEVGPAGDLNADRTILAPYWEVEYELMKDIGNGVKPTYPDFFPKYQLYKDQTADNQKSMREGKVEGSNWTSDDRNILNKILSNTSNRRDKMRRGEVKDPSGKIWWSKIDALIADSKLEKWEYGPSKNTFFKHRIKRKLKNANQGVLDNTLIDQWVQDFLLNPPDSIKNAGERHSDYR